jgi:23S rRNA pseudouridine1911/1915/1917 synthase
LNGSCAAEREDVLKEFYITENQEEERIDRYLAEMLPDCSRSYIQKLIKEKLVCVNKLPVKASCRLLPGDLVTVTVPESKEPDIEPENIPLDILYEDSDIIIVNKPKQMVVHPAPGHYSGTLVNALMYHCRDELSGINGMMRPGIVHRIDMDTTGSLVVCKNDIAHQSIAEQLKVHSIRRVYVAIVHGSVRDDKGTVDAPIGRHPVDRKKMSVHAKNGKRAVTHYRVLQRFQGGSPPAPSGAGTMGCPNGGYTYLECELETGRTHQIRVHMASIGHPLLGDLVYGPHRCPIPGLQGQTLHAKTLGLIHPRTGEYLEVEAPLPEYFTDLLAGL